MIWYYRIQSSAVFKQQDVRWCGFRWSIPLSIDYVRNSIIVRAISTTSCSYAYEIDTAKIVAAFCRISYCLHDFENGWISSSSMFKQQDIRRCDFRWSIPISIDYVWRGELIDRAISTSWYSYCIWNSYIKITTSNWLDVENNLSRETVEKSQLRRR